MASVDYRQHSTSEPKTKNHELYSGRFLNNIHIENGRILRNHLRTKSEKNGNEAVTRRDDGQYECDFVLLDKSPYVYVHTSRGGRDDPATIVHVEHADAFFVGESADDKMAEKSKCCRCDLLLLIRFTKSVCFHLFLLLMLVLSSSSIVMGWLYLDDCPAAGSAPIFLIVMGVAFDVILGLRLYVVCRRSLDAENTGPAMSHANCFALGIPLLMVLVAELIVFYSSRPVLEYDEDHYCNDVFSTYYFAWTGVCLAAIFSVLYSIGWKQNCCCVRTEVLFV